VVLSLDRDEAVATLQQMKRDLCVSVRRGGSPRLCVTSPLVRHLCALPRLRRWFDAGTRAILFQMTFYNTNTRELTNLRLLVEVFMSGQVLPSYRFETAKIVVYESTLDQVRWRWDGQPVLGPP
jgi:hypothetical protein